MGGCNVQCYCIVTILSMADMVCLPVCRNCGVHEQLVLGLYGSYVGDLGSFHLLSIRLLSFHLQMPKNG